MAVPLKLKYALRHAMKRNPLVARWCGELRTRELSDPRNHQFRQRQLLERLYHDVRQVPAYAVQARQPHGDALAYLRDAFPIIDKDEILRRQTDFLRHGRMPRQRFAMAETSGSTGTPMDVFRSLGSMLYEEAFHLQHWYWAGWRLGRRQAVLRGDTVVPIHRSEPPFWFEDVLGSQLLLSTRHLNRDTALAFATELQRFGARQLRAYPSAAHELAVLVEAAGIPLRFDSVITGSEMLYDFQRDTIERVFGARVYDFYGMAERVAFAAECERGRMHVNPEYGVVEIVDARGNPTDGEGTLVGTSLHNRAMPLIRYRMNDTARWSHEPCPCGRTYPVIEKISGRLADQLFDLDGRPVNCTMIGFAFDGMHNIRKAQVAQVAADQWVIRIVPSPHYSPDDGARVLMKLARDVSPRVSAHIDLVTEIPSQPSGKYKWVVQEWRRALPIWPALNSVASQRQYGAAG